MDKFSPQEEELNGNGELYIRKHPNLKVKLVDGSSLAVAIVLNSIPKGTTQVLLRGNLSKVAYSVALVLCQRGTQVCMYICFKFHYIYGFKIFALLWTSTHLNMSDVVGIRSN